MWGFSISRRPRRARPVAGWVSGVSSGPSVEVTSAIWGRGRRCRGWCASGRPETPRASSTTAGLDVGAAHGEPDAGRTPRTGCSLRTSRCSPQQVPAVGDQEDPGTSPADRCFLDQVQDLPDLVIEVLGDFTRLPSRTRRIRSRSCRGRSRRKEGLSLECRGLVERRQVPRHPAEVVPVLTRIRACRGGAASSARTTANHGPCVAVASNEPPQPHGL